MPLAIIKSEKYFVNDFIKYKNNQMETEKPAAKPLRVKRVCVETFNFSERACRCAAL